MSLASSLDITLSESDGWYDLLLTPAGFRDDWKALSKLPGDSWVVLSDVHGGKKVRELLAKLSVDESHRAFLEEISYYVAIVPIYEVRQIAECDPFDISFCDSADKPTPDRLSLLKSSHPDPADPGDLSYLKPFLESCNGTTAYWMNDGYQSFTLSRNRGMIVKLVRNALESALYDTRDSGQNLINESQMERLLDHIVGYWTAASRGPGSSGAGTVFTSWREPKGETAEAREIRLEGDEITVSEWETRRNPNYVSSNARRLWNLVVLLVFLGIVAGIVYGIYRLVSWLM